MMVGIREILGLKADRRALRIYVPVLSLFLIQEIGQVYIWMPGRSVSTAISMPLLSEYT